MHNSVTVDDSNSSAVSLSTLPSQQEQQQYTVSPFHEEISSGRRGSEKSAVRRWVITGETRDSAPALLNDASINGSTALSRDICIEQHAPQGEEIQAQNKTDDLLRQILKSRRGDHDEVSGLSRRVRRFYKDQDELINVYESFNKIGDDEEEEKKKYDKTEKHTKKLISILTYVSLGANIALFAFKIAGAVVSKSLSVISSVIDSAVDLLTSVILFWAARAMKKRDIHHYPQGRTRLEPIAIIILSVVMCAASVLVIYESLITIVNDAQVFTETNTTKTLSEIDMSALPVSSMVVTIVSKSILFVLCYRIPNPTMYALAEDHRNDVVSNIVALACGLVGTYAYRNKINQKVIVIDPIGAILISFYIIVAWIRQANRQIKRLSGYTANPQFLSQITWLTFHHSPLITKIDTVRAFHFGTSFLVEVDIVLPETMSLKQAHDIGEELQTKIENLPEVERAFVHLDYEYKHKASKEHKIV